MLLTQNYQFNKLILKYIIYLLFINWACTKVSIFNGILVSKTNFSSDVWGKKIQLRLDKDIVIIARCVNLCSTMAKGQG